MSVGFSATPDKQQVGEGLFDPNQNEILAQLSRADLAVITAGADEVELPIKHEVFDRGDSLQTVYFPLTGLISMVIVLEKGAIIEAHTVGREGFVGTPLLNDVATTRCRGVCQVAGKFLAMPTTDFTARLESLPDLKRRLRRYTQFATDVLAQNTACNSIHSIEQRCARWLLAAHDRVSGDDLLITADGIGSNEFSLTQEFLSQMLAVRRPGVNVAIRSLTRQELVSHRYGHMTILDRPGLTGASCECYGTIVERAREILN